MLLRHKRKAIHAKKTVFSNPYRTQLSVMEKELNKSYNKLSNHLSKGANFKIIQQDNKELLMLLGECSFIAKECERLNKTKSKTTISTKTRSKTSRRIWS